MAKGLCSLHYTRQQHPLYNTWKLLRSRWPGQFPTAWSGAFEPFLADVGERPTPKHQLRRKDETLPFSVENVRWVAHSPPAKADSYTPEARAEYSRSWMLKARYGLGREEHEEMLKEQNFVCAICKTDETFVNSRTQKKQELSVDHCHATGRVRGLLCLGCNRMLGYARDNADTLRAAIAYLEKHKSA